MTPDRSVEQLCRAHHCYEQLFDVCEALDRSELGGSQSAPGARLHAHMAGMPPEDGASSEDTFARFVFQRLHHEGRHADLLQLPDMFLSGAWCPAWSSMLPGNKPHIMHFADFDCIIHD